MPELSLEFWIGFVFAVLALVLGLGVTLAMDSRTKGEFRFAAACFLLCGLITIYGIGRLEMSVDWGRSRLIIGYVLFAFVAVLTTEGIRWARNRHLRAVAHESGTGGLPSLTPPQPPSNIAETSPAVPPKKKTTRPQPVEPKPSRASNSDNITEEIWFGVHMQASKGVKDDFGTLDEKVLKVYNGNGSLNTIDQWPPEYYETAWENTFGKILICGADNVTNSSMSFVVSEHPQMSVSVSNNAFPKGTCALHVTAFVPHTGHGLTLEGAGPLPQHAYILELPLRGRSYFALRFHMWSEEIKQLNQGYLPMWKSFAIDDASEKIRLEISRKGPNWTAIPKFEQSLPDKILLQTGLSVMGPWIVREYTLVANHPEQFGRGDDASQVIIWAFTWKRTGYSEQPNAFTGVDGKMPSGLQMHDQRH